MVLFQLPDLPPEVGNLTNPARVPGFFWGGTRTGRDPRIAPTEELSSTWVTIPAEGFTDGWGVSGDRIKAEAGPASPGGAAS